MLKPFGRYLFSGLGWFEQTGLKDVWGCRALCLNRQQEADADGYQSAKYLSGPCKAILEVKHGVLLGGYGAPRPSATQWSGDAL